MSITEKLRRGVHSLEGNAEIRNLISEEEDVVKAYDNIIRQKQEAVTFLGKLAARESPEVQAATNRAKVTFPKATTHSVQEITAQHLQLYKEFALRYKEHIGLLKEILARQEKLDAAEKKLKELEKKKAGGVDEQRKTRDLIAEQLAKFREQTLRDAHRQMTEAYLDFYTKCQQLMAKELSALTGQPLSSTPSQLPPSPSQVPPQVQYQQQPPPQQGYPQQYPPQGYPQQVYYPPQPYPQQGYAPQQAYPQQQYPAQAYPQYQPTPQQQPQQPQGGEQPQQTPQYAPQAQQLSPEVQQQAQPLSAESQQPAPSEAAQPPQAQP